MMVRKIFLPVTEIRELYLDKLWSAHSIAEQFSCSAETVRHALKEAGVKLRHGNALGKPIGRRIHLPMAELTDLYVKHLWSVDRLAERYGCSEPTIGVRLREAGVTIRACNDTKRGARSPLRITPPVPEMAIVIAYQMRPQLSISALARLVGCTGQLIARVLDDHGIPHKPLSQVIGDTRNGPANPNWRDDLTDEERHNRRDNAKSVKWRAQVYERDRFTCQSCDDANGGNLNAHHIESYNSNRALRWEVSNGVTLCETCHFDFHKRFGYGNNTAAQLAEFLSGERIAA